MGLKVQISAAQTACRQIKNPYFKSEVAGADRRSLYFISGRRKAVTFFSQPRSQKWANYLD